MTFANFSKGDANNSSPEDSDVDESESDDRRCVYTLQFA